MRAIHPDAIPLIRRADSTAYDIIEAHVTARNTDGTQRAHIRQTKADWAQADGGAAAVDALFTRFENGDLRLKDTTNTLFTRTSHPNNQTDLNREAPFDAAHVEWRGPEPTDVEILRVKCWLNPKVNAAQRMEVKRWRLEIYALTTFYTDVLSFDGVYTPLAESLDVLVTGESASEVTFDYSGFLTRPRPKSVIPQPNEPGSSLQHPPSTLFVIYALNENGDAAGNVALGVNDAETSFTSGGQTLRRRRFTTHPELGFVDAGLALGVPHLVIENGTYTAATITFSSGNLFDLGGSPTGDVELTGLVQLPPGTSVTLDVRNDADSAYVAFTNGQMMEADLALNATQTRKMRATLTPNAAGTLSPTLRKLGMREITRIDFSRVATIEDYEQAFSPETHKVEIPKPRLVAVKDGPQDFRSKIEKLLAEHFINDILFRWWVGHDALTRDQWTHMDDFLVLDYNPRRAAIDVQLVGLCALLKDLAPPFSPGTNYAPDGTQSIGTWTDLAGGTTNIHLGIDEAVVDETDGIQSVTSPSNAEYIFTFPTPSDIAGRRLFFDVDYAKDASGGETIQLTLRIYQSGTIIVDLIKADIGANRVQTTLELSEAQIALLTDLPNLRGAVIAHVTGGAGARRAKVFWARFRSGGRRQVVTYANQTLKDVYDDLLQNRLAIPPNLIGPGVEDDVTTVSKQITGLRQRTPGAKDVIAKTEIEAIGVLADVAIGSSEGRIKAFNLLGGQAIRALFRSRRIKIGDTSPGHERRIPEFFVPYRWEASREEFKDEVRAFHEASILKIGTVGLGPPKWLDEEIAKWIDTDALAERIGIRVVERLGTGEMLWSWNAMDRHPELEMVDVVAVETAQFVSRDPNLDMEVKGRKWAIGPLQRVGGGRYFTIWVRGYADILAGTQAASRLGFAIPDLYELTPNVSQTGVVTAVFKASKAGSVKYAVSTSSEPTAATVRAAAPQVLDGDGILRTGTLATLTASQSLFIAAFAYERGDGTGTESKLATAKITHYEGGVSADGFESARTGYTVSFTITARDADFEQVKLHYRSVTAVSDSYTSPSPTSTSLNNQPYTPAAVVIDRGLTDRIFEWWAEDASGNKSSIQRLAIPALTSSDKENAITSFAGDGGSFTGTCPDRVTRDTLTWNEASGVPASWAAKLYRCLTASCSPFAGTLLNANATSPATRDDPGTNGTTFSYIRTYGLRLENSYGEIVDDDVSAEFNTTFDDCP